MTLREYGDYTIVNECHGNRSGFYHLSSLYWDGTFMTSYKAQYYNRTWESYEFRSSMRCVLSNFIDSIESMYIGTYKGHHNIKRLTAKNKDIALKECNDSNFMNIQTLREFYKSL